VPPGSIDFIAESSLSLLSEPHLKRIRRNGFNGILPGIEFWYDLGNKSKTSEMKGMDKVQHVSEHVNMILRYIPYVHTDFIFGLDVDERSEPFELTKLFVDLTPGAFLDFSLLTAFGQAARRSTSNSNAPTAFYHSLNNNHAMNVKPNNYSRPEFYDHLIDLTKHAFSCRAIIKRFRANKIRHGAKLAEFFHRDHLRDMPVLPNNCHYVGLRRRLGIVRYLEFALQFIFSDHKLKKVGNYQFSYRKQLRSSFVLSHSEAP